MKSNSSEDDIEDYLTCLTGYPRPAGIEITPKQSHSFFPTDPEWNRLIDVLSDFGQKSLVPVKDEQDSGKFQSELALEYGLDPVRLIL